MKPTVFGIGKGKTGSHSLAEALEQMGFKTHHIGNAVYNKNTAIKDRIVANKVNGENPMLGVDGYDAVIDYPIHAFFKEIDQHCKNAKFILTYRPPDDCALSWCRMLSLNHKIVGKNWTKQFTRYANECREHVDDVMSHFWGRPEKLLFLDMRDSDNDKWRLLSKFLGVECPKGAYPRKYDHRQWEPESRIRGL